MNIEEKNLKKNLKKIGVTHINKININDNKINDIVKNISRNKIIPNFRINFNKMIGGAREVIMKHTDIYNEEIIHENIAYDDIRPPHTIDMYKIMIKLYSAIESGALSIHQQKLKLNSNEKMKTYYGPHNLTSSVGERRDFFPCNNEIREDDFIDYNIKFINSVNCNRILFNCQKVLLFEIGNNLIINFNIGVRNDIRTINNDSVNKFILENYDIINDPKYNSILLCGHSEGMVASQLISYVLMCYEDESLFKKNRSLFTSDEIIKIDKSITEKICICGSGGYPFLFQNEEQFKEYYTYYKGRYLHIVNGYKNFTLSSEYVLLIDPFTNVNEFNNYINYKFALYTISNNNEERKTKVCYFGFIINGNVADTTLDNYNNELRKSYPITMMTTSIHDFSMYRYIINIYYNEYLSQSSITDTEDIPLVE